MNQLPYAGNLRRRIIAGPGKNDAANGKRQHPRDGRLVSREESGRDFPLHGCRCRKKVPEWWRGGGRFDEGFARAGAKQAPLLTPLLGFKNLA